MKLYVDQGSTWKVDHETQTMQDGTTRVRHFLKSEVFFDNSKEGSEKDSSYAQLVLDSGFFSANEETGGKKKKEKKIEGGFDNLSYENLSDIHQILKDGCFDISEKHHNATLENHRYINYRLIPVLSGMEDFEGHDKRVLVLSGLKGEHVAYDSRPQKFFKKPIVIRFAKAYGSLPAEGEKGYRPKIGLPIRETQFAAVLDDGECCAYYVTQLNSRGYFVTNIICYMNRKGNVFKKSFTKWEWKDWLLRNHIILPNKAVVTAKPSAPIAEDDDNDGSEEVPVPSAVDEGEPTDDQES